MENENLNKILESVKENVQELSNKNYPKNILIQNALNRGMQIMKGDFSKQIIFDLCVIALTVLIQTENKNANN